MQLLATRFLRSAGILLHDGDPDSTTSRAYYVTFHVAEALLLPRGYEFSKHRKVHSAFARESVNTGSVQVIVHRALLDSYEDRAKVSEYTGLDGSQESQVRLHPYNMSLNTYVSYVILFV